MSEISVVFLPTLIFYSGVVNIGAIIHNPRKQQEPPNNQNYSTRLC
jgi:hypothetical protein